MKTDASEMQPRRSSQTVFDRSFFRAARCFSFLGRPSVFVSALFAMAVAGAAVVVLQIPRGLGTHDEAWYLMVIRDHVSENGGAWNMLLGFLPDALVVWRSLSWLIRIVSCPLLVYGLLAVSGVKTRLKPAVWAALSVAVVLAADSDPVWVAAYYNLNVLCFSVSFAAAAFAAARSGCVAVAAAVLSGAFSFFLLPVQPLNFPSGTLLVFGTFWLLEDETGRRVRGTIAFVLGMVIGAALFFGLCESPSDYLEMFRSVAAEAAKGSDGHSVKGLFRWICHSGRFVCFSVLVPSVALAFAARSFGRPRRAFLVNAALATVAIGLFVGNLVPLWGFFVGYHPAFPAEFPWIAACFLLFAVPSDCRIRDVSFLALVIVIPIALSFGTAVPLTTRCRAYLWPFAIASFLRAAPFLSVGTRQIGRGILLVFVAVSAFCSVNQHFGTWIVPEKSFFAKKTKDGATGLLVPENAAASLSDLRSAGIESVSIQPLDRYCWGYVYALCGHPLSRTFECENTDLGKAIPTMERNSVYLIAPLSRDREIKGRMQSLPLFRIEKVLALDNEWGKHSIWRVERQATPKSPLSHEAEH